MADSRKNTAQSTTGFLARDGGFFWTRKSPGVFGTDAPLGFAGIQVVIRATKHLAAPFLQNVPFPKMISSNIPWFEQV